MEASENCLEVGCGTPGTKENHVRPSSKLPSGATTPLLQSPRLRPPFQALWSNTDKVGSAFLPPSPLSTPKGSKSSQPLSSTPPNSLPLKPLEGSATRFSAQKASTPRSKKEVPQEVPSATKESSAKDPTLLRTWSGGKETVVLKDTQESADVHLPADISLEVEGLNKAFQSPQPSPTRRQLFDTSSPKPFDSPSSILKQTLSTSPFLKNQLTQQGDTSPSTRPLEKPRSPETPTGLKAGARRVRLHAPAPDEIEKEEPVKQAVRWFPRERKESYLERKIRKLQEAAVAESLLQSAVPHLSRIERDKLAAAKAAEAAAGARRTALVEASWCRILEAAGISSPTAITRAEHAEESALNAIAAAEALGVDIYASTPSSPAKPRGVSNRAPLREVIPTSLVSGVEVEREVVVAIKIALEEGVEKLSAKEPKEEESVKSQPVVDSPVAPVLGFATPPRERHVNGLESPENPPPFVTPPRAAPPKARRGVGFAACFRACVDPKKVGRYADVSSDEDSEGMVPDDVSKDAFTVAENCLEVNDDVSMGDSPSSADVIKGSADVSKCNDDVITGSADVSKDSPDKENLRQGGCPDPPSEEGDTQRSARISKQVAKSKLVTEMTERIQKLAPEQKGALRAIIATRRVAGVLNSLAPTQPPPRLSKLEEQKKALKDVKLEVSTGLGDVLVKRMSKLEAEKLAFAKEEKGGRNKGGKKGGETERPGLGDVLVKRLSRLEREKLEAAKQESTVAVTKIKESGLSTQIPSLGDVLVKKMSRLEREKAEALKLSEGSSRRTVKKTTEVNPGLGLGEGVVKKVSKLEIEKARSKLSVKKGKGLTVTIPQPSLVLEGALETSEVSDDIAGSADVAAPEGPVLANVLITELTESEIETLIKAEQEKDLKGSYENEKVPGLGEFLTLRTQFQELQAEGHETVKDVKFVDWLKAQKTPLSKDSSVATQDENDRLKPMESEKQGTHKAPLPGQGLGDILVKKKSKLELEKEAAAASASTRGSRKTIDNVQGEGGLGDGMVKRLTRLEREKAAASAKSLGHPGAESSRATKEQRAAETQMLPGLSSYLKPSLIKLEEEVEAVNLGKCIDPASTGIQRQNSVQTSQGNVGAARSLQGPQSEVKEPVRAPVHMSRLQRAELERQSMWGAEGLGNLKKHTSKLEKEQASWRQAEQEARQSRPKR